MHLTQSLSRSVAQSLAVLGLAVALALAGCVLPQPESPAAQPWIAAVGNLNNLNVAIPASMRGAQGFEYWQRDAQGLWRDGGFGQGEPAAFAAWREDLLVFFASGRYGLFGPGRPDVRPSPVPAWTPVAACEDGLAADAFGWDASGEPIHARFEDEKWSWRRAEVSLERDKMLDVSAVRFAGRLFLVWREEAPRLTEAAAGYRLRFVYLDKGRWSGPHDSRLRVASAPRVAADGRRFACLFQKPASGDAPPRWALAAYATTDEDWHEMGEVAGEMPPGPVALGRCGGRFFVAAPGEGGPRVAPLEWPAGPPVRVAEFTPLAAAGKRPEGGGEFVLLLGVATLGLFLLVFSWRRARDRAGAPAPAAEPAALVPATVARRAAAVTIDYVLISLLMTPLMQRFWPDLGDRLLAGDPTVWPDATIVHLIGVGAIVVYASIAEGLFGRTLGKHLMGIEVRSAQGGAPVAWWQAVVRNALRVVDELPAAYLAGLISILIGPKPQRIGDRLARTMVVLRPSRQARAET
jgi:hypothetical protein